MKIITLITTYNRPESLLILLKELKRDKLSDNLFLIIFDDGSTKNYLDVFAYLKQNFHFDYYQNEENRGKENYWQLVNAAFQEVKKKEFDYFLMLPDDIRLTDNFLEKSIESFNNIEDKNKVCLNLWNDYSRYKKSTWTGLKTKEIEFSGLKFHKIGWVDMCFLANKYFFEIINYSIKQVESIYLFRKNLSSGVGAQLSQAMINARANMYQVIKSYVIHDDHESVMHKSHREKVPLITNHEWVTASMATIPSRIEALREVVNSILPQVDQLDIYLNDFEKVPEFLKQEKINTYLSDNEAGDLGDAGKFYKSSEVKGYHFTIDDDLIYPEDYVKTAIHAIERYKRKYIVSFHGRSFHKKPVHSYYKSAEVRISCLRFQGRDVIIDIPGTGVMAYHTDTIKFDIKDFEAINMADVWAGKKAKQEAVKVMVLRHDANWIKHSSKINLSDTIFANCSQNDTYQTEVLNSFI